MPPTTPDTSAILGEARALLQSAGVETRFAEVLVEMAKTACRKGHDYSPGADPYANAKSSEQLGVPAWIGIAIRLGDKFRRLQALALTGELKNEPIEDTALDIAVYAVILLIVRREEQLLRQRELEKQLDKVGVYE